MPTNRSNQHKIVKPWHARVRYQNIVYSLGYYATEEEALMVENEFCQQNGITRRVPNTTPYETIMSLQAKGMTYAQIAAHLGTTKTRISNAISHHRRKERANAH
jgi:DNA-binding CsgD family transcriptional regulator